MKWKAYAVLIVLLLTSLGALYKAIEHGIEQRVRAEELAKDLQTARREMAARDSAHQVEIAEKDSALNEAAENYAQDSVIAERKIAQLSRHLEIARQAGTPDSAIRAIEETVAAVRQEAETCNLTLRSCYEALGARDERIADLLAGQAVQDSLLAPGLFIAPIERKNFVPEPMILGLEAAVALKNPEDIEGWLVVAARLANWVLR